MGCASIPVRWQTVHHAWSCRRFNKSGVTYTPAVGTEFPVVSSMQCTAAMVEPSPTASEGLCNMQVSAEQAGMIVTQCAVTMIPGLATA